MIRLVGHALLDKPHSPSIDDAGDFTPAAETRIAHPLWSATPTTTGRPFDPAHPAVCKTIYAPLSSALNERERLAGSRHEPRRQENTDHRKGEADFHDRADEKADPGCNPSPAGATEVAVGGQLAEYGAGERSDDQAR